MSQSYHPEVRAWTGGGEVVSSWSARVDGEGLNVCAGWRLIQPYRNGEYYGILFTGPDPVVSSNSPTCQDASDGRETVWSLDHPPPFRAVSKD